jgi:penicillin-binding protein 2
LVTNDSPRLRLGIVGIVAISLFASLLARLWFLQILAGPEYQVAAATNRVRIVSEPAPRGRILDAERKVIVDNRQMVVVTVNRKELGDLRDAEQLDVLSRLAYVLGMPLEALQEKLNDQRVSPFSPVPVAEDVPEELFVFLREHNYEFPSVDVSEVAVRAYPEGALAAHLLGYVGEINEEELADRKARGYKLGDQIGKAGVERVFEEDLRGVPGEIKLEVDANGRVLRELSRRRPVQGHDVQLSIDVDVQRLAEERLVQGLESARDRKTNEDGTHFRARAGSVVVLDATNGSVVAMASYPSYDPAAFVNGISSQEYAELTDPENGTPFNNWAVQGEYAPGSTFKLITATAALARGMIDRNTTINDTGSFRIPGCSGRCVVRNAGSTAYGNVNVTRGLTVSSDVFFYSLGFDFWNRRGEFGDAGIQDTARDYGFGSQTGIPLGSEKDGRVPTPEWKASLHEDHPDSYPDGRWYAGDNVNIAIGQGDMLVTPLQLANAYATFANGGTRYVPSVATAVLSQNGNVLRQIQPTVGGRIDLPPNVRDPILTGLMGVTTDGRGTAKYAFQGFPHDQYPVAGKTGTAQRGAKQDTALFAAFAPATDPKFALAVVMEESGFGSAAAAPVARAIFGELSGLEKIDRVETVQGGSG